MIERFAGINPRLENVLQEKESSEQGTKEANPKEPLNGNKNDLTVTTNLQDSSKPEEPKILKGLRGLPPALLQKILEKEKAKNVQDVTQNSEQRKRIEQMEELLSVTIF